MEEIEREYKRITELIMRLDEQCRLKEHTPSGARPSVQDGSSAPQHSAPVKGSILSTQHYENSPVALHMATAMGGVIPHRSMESPSAVHGLSLLPHRRHRTSVSSRGMQVPHRWNPTLRRSRWRS